MVDDAQTLSHAPAPARITYAEQRLFELSPFNLWITGVLLYLILAGAYALAAAVDGVPWLVRTPTGWTLQTQAQLALCLDLIFCSILTVQRYSRFKDMADEAAMARSLKPGVVWGLMPISVTRLRAFTLVGVVFGGLILVVVLFKGVDIRVLPAPAISAWFAVMTLVLTALFFRGLELTRAGSAHAREMIENGLEVDLLRIERLYPWGRAAARTALVWFTISASICLLFVSGGLTPYMIIVLLICAAMGVWVFLGTLSLVHLRIRAAKAMELERVRSQIAQLKHALDSDVDASAKVQGLLAYETRIAAVADWPFDQTILVRVGVSALILTVPWFGQAVAGVVVEHLGKVIH